MISLTSPIVTPYHHIAAAPKLACLCLYTFAALLTDNLHVQMAGALLVGALYLLAGWHFAKLGFRRLRPIWWFIAVIVLWHCAHREFSIAAEISLRLAATMGLANLVTMTTRLDDLISLVEHLTRPLRRLGMPLHGLGLMIALVIRFTPVLAKKGSLLAESWKSRSRRPRPGWRMVAPLAVLAIDDSERVAESLRARGGIEVRNRVLEWNAPTR